MYRNLKESIKKGCVTIANTQFLVLVYNIYGCPKDMDVKIGNFTQSKLEVN